MLLTRSAGVDDKRLASVLQDASAGHLSKKEGKRGAAGARRASLGPLATLSSGTPQLKLTGTGQRSVLTIWSLWSHTVPQDSVVSVVLAVVIKQC